MQGKEGPGGQHCQQRGVKRQEEMSRCADGSRCSCLPIQQLPPTHQGLHNACPRRSMNGKVATDNELWYVSILDKICEYHVEVLQQRL